MAGWLEQAARRISARHEIGVVVVFLRRDRVGIVKLHLRGENSPGVGQEASG